MITGKKLKIAPKLHRKIRHHEKVCHAYDIGFHTQGQGHSQRLKVKSFHLNY